MWKRWSEVYFFAVESIIKLHLTKTLLNSFKQNVYYYIYNILSYVNISYYILHC